MKRWLPFIRAAPGSVVQGRTPAAPARVVPPSTDVSTPGRPKGSYRSAEHEGTPMSAVLLAWLFDCEPAPGDTPPTSAETIAVRHLDTLNAAGALPAALLSRAPAVIPQLLHLLRQDDASLFAMAQRVSADPVLTAEVLRLSRSAFYRTRTEPADIAHAIAMLGRDGLHIAIAAVVLKPLFDAPSGSLSRHAAARLWEHSTAKASLCAAGAAERGGDRFEGYLAGLLHNTGWTMLLRALDSCTGVTPPFSASIARQLGRRKDAFFAKAVGAWRITPTLTALCDEVRQVGLRATGSLLASALWHADRDATLQFLAPRASDKDAPIS